MYQPQTWEELANVTIPATIASLVGNSSDTAEPTQKCVHLPVHVNSFAHCLVLDCRRHLGKRTTFTQNSYTEPAVVCADSVDADPTLTMNDIFNEIVNVTSTVSPSCEFLLNKHVHNA